MVVTGLRRREAIVAPANGSLARRVGDMGAVCCSGGGTAGVGGRRSFAASQSSSANYSNVSNCFRMCLKAHLTLLR
jgi:hypothetical protein